jgi:hypothetical protein
VDLSSKQIVLLSNFETEKTVSPGQQRLLLLLLPVLALLLAHHISHVPRTTELEEIRDYLIKTYGYDPGPYQGL